MQFTYEDSETFLTSMYIHNNTSTFFFFAAWNENIVFFCYVFSHACDKGMRGWPDLSKLMCPACRQLESKFVDIFVFPFVDISQQSHIAVCLKMSSLARTVS